MSDHKKSTDLHDHVLRDFCQLTTAQLRAIPGHCNPKEAAAFIRVHAPIFLWESNHSRAAGMLAYNDHLTCSHAACWHMLLMLMDHATED